MAETAHARSRRASLAGLVLQVIAAAAAFALGRGLYCTAMDTLALYIAGGIPIWFIVLLVFRQHELAALEALDLEELRREKQATGGSEAMFGAEGTGFMVAEARLKWMQRWLVPVFGLLTAAYLVGVGGWSWIVISGRDEAVWGTLRNVEIGMVLSALLMLFLFFFARYASGMARVTEWQLLRGGASYMLGNAVLAMAVIVALGAHLYQGTVSWEHGIAYAIPILMVVLGAEMLVSFLVDIYRPRAPGVEPRACFDSRLLGLISEPGGLAHSVAEAINYQFGFQVTQTWFYQLLQRAFIGLVAVGAVTVWMLSCFIVVQPYERAIVERFGRQIDPEHPLEPGFHLKWPAPIEVVRKYNTDQLHEFYIGYRVSDQPDREELEKQRQEGKAWIELWTDRYHSGREHFDFVIAPTPGVVERSEAGPRRDKALDERAAQHIVRMQLVVQYKIRPSDLVDFTRQVGDPHLALRRVAWNEVVRLAASSHIDQLMGELRLEMGQLLRERIARQADELELGLDVIFVGIIGVHPERTVAEAFRGVVTAQQEKIAKIREARVEENKILSRVAGDKRKALALSHAVEQVHKNELRRSELDRKLRELSPAEPPPESELDALRPLMIARLEAAWRLELDRQELGRVNEDFELGLGGSLRNLQQAEQVVDESSEALRVADEALEARTAPLRAAWLEDYEPAAVAAGLEHAQARVALAFWNEQLEAHLAGLEGEAAAILAGAQARRWQQEQRAAGEVAFLQNERYAYAAAPEIYKARSYLQVLVNGIKDARKYFLAFEPRGRSVHIRLEAQEQARPDLVDMPTSVGP